MFVGLRASLLGGALRTFILVAYVLFVVSAIDWKDFSISWADAYVPISDSA